MFLHVIVLANILLYLQASADQRGRLMMSTERLNQSSDRIRESRKTMLETEELGVSILQDLHQQRQSLLHANNTVCLHDFGLNSIILVLFWWNKIFMISITSSVY